MSGLNLSRRTFLQAAAVPAPTAELQWASVGEVSRLLRGGKVSPVELTELCLSRSEKLNPRLNAWITLSPKTALGEAREAEKEIRAGRWRGPLHGVPVGLKDLYD